MARRVRKPLLAIVPIALVVVLGIVLLPGGSISKRAAGPGCNNPADSALNQYCDSIPGSTGAHTPRAGQQAVAAVLSPRLVGRIRHTHGLAGRALLSLPAPGRRHHFGPVVQSASVGGLLAPMIIVLAGLGIALGAMTVATRIRTSRLSKTEPPRNR
jgi:hypothetical protein